jgi:hypothetical protein
VGVRSAASSASRLVRSPSSVSSSASSMNGPMCEDSMAEECLWAPGEEDGRCPEEENVMV